MTNRALVGTADDRINTPRIAADHGEIARRRRFVVIPVLERTRHAQPENESRHMLVFCPVVLDAEVFRLHIINHCRAQVRDVIILRHVRQGIGTAAGYRRIQENFLWSRAAADAVAVYKEAIAKHYGLQHVLG